MGFWFSEIQTLLLQKTINPFIYYHNCSIYFELYTINELSILNL